MPYALFSKNFVDPDVVVFVQLPLWHPQKILGTLNELPFPFRFQVGLLLLEAFVLKHIDAQTEGNHTSRAHHSD